RHPARTSHPCVWPQPGMDRAPEALHTLSGDQGSARRTSYARSNHSLATRRRNDPMLTMYSTTWCGYCRRLKTMLDREGIAYTEVNIEQDPAAAEFVMSVNGGNQTVPTVRFPDGSTMTNPSLAHVKERLAEIGSGVN